MSESARDLQSPINWANCYAKVISRAKNCSDLVMHCNQAMIPEFKKLGLLPVHLLVLSVCR